MARTTEIRDSIRRCSISSKYCNIKFVLNLCGQSLDKSLISERIPGVKKSKYLLLRGFVVHSWDFSLYLEYFLGNVFIPSHFYLNLVNFSFMKFKFWVIKIIIEMPILDIRNNLIRKFRCTWEFENQFFAWKFLKWTFGVDFVEISDTGFRYWR